jgi:hypothetical protein
MDILARISLLIVLIWVLLDKPAAILRRLYLVYRRFFGLVKTYYVSPQGHDRLNDGTLEYPWFTLKRAVKACRTGDSIHVLPGTYITAEPITLPNVDLTIEGCHVDGSPMPVQWYDPQKKTKRMD